jgi:uncharacterized membrane protein
MPAILRFLKTTLVGGVLVLLPLVACGYAVAAVAGVVIDVTRPVASRLVPFGLAETTVGAHVVAGLLILAICFLLGLLVRTTLGRAVGRAVEAAVLNRLPGYRAMRRLASQVAGDPADTFGVPVWVRLGDARRMGFVVEEHADGEVAVFVPFSPVLTVGEVLVVASTRVERIAAPFMKVTKSVSEMGVGSAALRGARSAPTSG